MQIGIRIIHTTFNVRHSILVNASVFYNKTSPTVSLSEQWTVYVILNVQLPFSCLFTSYRDGFSIIIFPIKRNMSIDVLK